MIAIFGGGEIAGRGIVPILGGHLEHVDVRDPDAVDRTMKAKLLPGVYRHAEFAVIYTAGVSRPASVADSKPDNWREELEVNCLGAYHVARSAIAYGATHFIAIASLAGLYGKPNHSGYSASKAGLISLVQSLAMEGHNAYAISPGRVDTAMRERDYPGEDPRTRLDPLLIGGIVRDMLYGIYAPGDNVIIRMRGHEVLPIEVHRGDGWRERLRVGEPPTC